MIISKRNDDGTIAITVNNGDVAALTDLVEKWELKDDAAVLKFAVGAMLNAKDQKLYVDVDGNKGVLVAPDELKKESPQE
jgi:hypothetical protein